ncbi:MAG: thiamine pyrophosphate-binding protein, partial [Thermomicrobiaceae bacterium]|nr:thiamine pyrophosphate-binding protein [Thermomicrobiaceae bacterium]
LLAGAWEPLRELAETLQAPVVMTAEGKGAVSDRSYLAQNVVAARELLPSSDVVLAVGTRFLQPATSTWGPRAGQTVIQLDVDPEEVGRNYPPTIGIVADADLGLRALVDRVAKHNRRRESREAELSAVKRAVAAKLAEVQPVAAYALAIREELPDDGIIVVDSTQVGYWSWVGFPVYEPRTFLTSGYQGTLGFAYPTALGAQVGRPGAKVVSISGDGGFMYNVQELATAALHGIPVVAIVFNDDAYGNVMRIQQALFDGHVFATELRNPDFVKLAELFGVEGWRAERPEELRAALRAALARGRPALIEVPIARDVPSVFPLIMSGRAGQPWTWPGE